MTAWMSSAPHAALNNRTDARHLQGSGVLWWASLCMILPYRNAIGNDVVVLRTKAGSACFQDVFLEDWVGRASSVSACWRTQTEVDAQIFRDRTSFPSAFFPPSTFYFFSFSCSKSAKACSEFFMCFYPLKRKKRHKIVNSVGAGLSGRMCCTPRFWFLGSADYLMLFFIEKVPM